jgi:transposase-like protein
MKRHTKHHGSLRSVQPVQSTTLDWASLPVSMNSKEVASFLGIHPQTLRRWRSQCAQYSSPCFRIGRSVRYKRDSLRRWYENLGGNQI